MASTDNLTVSTTSVAELSSSDSPLTDYADYQLVILSPQTLRIIYVIIGMLGLAGNSLVITVIATFKPMRTGKTNIYITNQSLLDGVTSLMLILSNLIEGDGRYLSGLSDAVFCKIWLAKLQLWSLIVSSSYNTVAMTVERFISIVYPIWHKTKVSTSHIYISLIPVWMIGLVYQCAFKIPTSVIIDGKCFLFYQWPSLATKRVVGVLTVSIQFLVPLGVICICYTRMAYTLRLRVTPTQRPDNGHGPSSVPSGNKRDPLSRARKNIIKTLALMSIAYVLCWTINQTFFLLSNLGFVLDFTSVLYHTSVLLVFTNCCINPVIYFIKYELYQNGLKHLISKLTCGKIVYRQQTGRDESSKSDAAY